MRKIGDRRRASEKNSTSTPHLSLSLTFQNSQHNKTQTGRLVAIKKIRVANASEGVSVTALREVKLLRELRGHPNIIRLLEEVELVR